MKKLITFCLVILFVAGSANASITTYFGEDLSPVHDQRLATFPNATAAETSFLSQLIGVGTESFESFANGTTVPLNLSFPGAGTATLTGSGTVTTIGAYPATNPWGRYPTDGSNYLDTQSTNFTITFSAPVAAFGFYGIDIGDFSGQITITTVNGGNTVYNLPHTQGANGGSVLYWGIIDTDNLFTSIQFQNTGSSSDLFGFDEMTIGSLEQVIIPAPGAILLGSIGIGFVGWLRRRRTL
ncbi:MAG: PEP-CTERM sorting domain-containing protein [Planctomycetota bacterium]|jgi:hypothetical protein